MKGEFQQMWLERVHITLVYEATFGPYQCYLEPWLGRVKVWSHWAGGAWHLLEVSPLICGGGEVAVSWTTAGCVDHSDCPGPLPMAWASSQHGCFQIVALPT